MVSGSSRWLAWIRRYNRRIRRSSSSTCRMILLHQLALSAAVGAMYRAHRNSPSGCLISSPQRGAPACWLCSYATSIRPYSTHSDQIVRSTKTCPRLKASNRAGSALSQISLDRQPSQMGVREVARMSNAPLIGVKACVFDAYGTLFDFASAARSCRDLLGDSIDTLTALWRDKQLRAPW